VFSKLSPVRRTCLNAFFTFNFVTVYHQGIISRKSAEDPSEQAPREPRKLIQIGCARLVRKLDVVCLADIDEIAC